MRRAALCMLRYSSATCMLCCTLLFARSGRNGGGGFQEGQNKGTKAGKAGHGKNSGHDATATKREAPTMNKNTGLPLNCNGYRNGYFVGRDNKTCTPESAGIDNFAAQHINHLIAAGGAAPAASGGTNATLSSAGGPAGGLVAQSGGLRAGQQPAKPTCSQSAL